MSGSEIASNVRSHCRFATETSTRVSSVSLSSECLDSAGLGGVGDLLAALVIKDPRSGMLVRFCSQDGQNAIDGAQAGVHAQHALRVLAADRDAGAHVLARPRPQRLVGRRTTPRP